MVFTRNTPGLASPTASPGRPEAIAEVDEEEVEAALSARRPRTTTSDSIAPGSKKRPRLSTSSTASTRPDKGKGKAAPSLSDSPPLASSSTAVGSTLVSNPHYPSSNFQPKPGPITSNWSAPASNPSSTSAAATNPSAPAQPAIAAPAASSTATTAIGLTNPAAPVPTQAGMPAQVPLMHSAPTALAGAAAASTPSPATVANPTASSAARDSALVEQTINRVLLAVNSAATPALPNNTIGSRECCFL